MLQSNQGRAAFIEHVFLQSLVKREGTMSSDKFLNIFMIIFSIVLLVIYYYCGFLTWIFETFSIFGFVVCTIVAGFPAGALAFVIYLIIDSKFKSFFREESDLYTDLGELYSRYRGNIPKFKSELSKAKKKISCYAGPISECRDSDGSKCCRMYVHGCTFEFSSSENKALRNVMPGDLIKIKLGYDESDEYSIRFTDCQLK